MTVHSVWGPSSAARWIACPGSIEANAGPQGPSRFAAQEGTAAHALLEQCLLARETPYAYLGETVGSDGFEVDAEMCEAVSVATDFVFGFEDVNPQARLRVESSVDFSEAVGLAPGVAFGTLDICLEIPGVSVTVADYKHGRVYVSEQDNPQLRMYHLGLLQKRRQHGGLDPKVQLKSVVIQPRAAGSPVRTSVPFSELELDSWARNVVAPAVQAALKPNAERVPGKHCKYCADNGRCGAQYADVQANAARFFAGA